MCSYAPQKILLDPEIFGEFLKIDWGALCWLTQEEKAGSPKPEHIPSQASC